MLPEHGFCRPRPCAGPACGRAFRICGNCTSGRTVPGAGDGAAPAGMSAGAERRYLNVYLKTRFDNLPLHPLRTESGYSCYFCRRPDTHKLINIWNRKRKVKSIPTARSSWYGSRTSAPMRVSASGRCPRFTARRNVRGSCWRTPRPTRSSRRWKGARREHCRTGKSELPPPARSAVPESLSPPPPGVPCRKFGASRRIRFFCVRTPPAGCRVGLPARLVHLRRAGRTVLWRDIPMKNTGSAPGVFRGSFHLRRTDCSGSCILPPRRIGCRGTFSPFPAVPAVQFAAAGLLRAPLLFRGMGRSFYPQTVLYTSPRSASSE